MGYHIITCFFSDQADKQPLEKISHILQYTKIMYVIYSMREMIGYPF